MEEAFYTRSGRGGGKRVGGDSILDTLYMCCCTRLFERRSNKKVIFFSFHFFLIFFSFSRKS